jgi:autotransporter-associated beta strand protein
MCNVGHAEANYVYHERTTSDPGCGGQFVTTLNPSSAQTYPLRFKVEFQFYTDNVRVYYTTNGSTPAGAFGVPSGTTTVVSAAYVCNFGTPLVDVVSATIPAQPAGTVVKYIVSGWHSGGGAEIFGNGPGTPCGCGAPTSTSAQATVFQYTVGSTTDLYWDINGATAGAGGATPTGNWSTTAANWSAVFDGTAATAVWTSGRNAVFSAGSDASGAFTVTIPTALTAGGIKVEEGTVSLGSTAAATLAVGANVSISSGATLSVSSSTAIAPTTSATMSINGGTMRNTASTSAGSFVSTLFTTLTLNGGATVSYTGVNLLNIINATPKITGNGPLTKAGAGVLAIVGTAAGNNDWTGGTIVNDGELRIRSFNNALPLNTDVTVNSPGILNLNGLNQQIGSLAGNGAVGTGTGTLMITGSVSTVFSGVLKNITNAGASGVSTGNGRLIKDGIGAITFTGLNDLNGSVTITNGTINVAPTASLCGPICDVVVNGGNLNLSNTLQVIENLSSSATLTSGNVNLGAGHTLVCSNVSNSTYSGTISGPGNILKLNNGAGQRTLTLNGANTYDGITTIDGGNISVGNETALGSTAGYTEVGTTNEIIFTGAAVNFNCAEPFRIGGPGGSDGGVIAVLASAAPTLSGPFTLTADSTITVSGSASAAFSNSNAFTSLANQTLTLAGGANPLGQKSVTGAINLGSGGLTKTQGGEWILMGSNSYTGPTLITAGSLLLSGSASIAGSTNIALSSNARFDVSYLTTTMALGASQTLSLAGTNSVLNGNLNLAAGALAITYTNGLPSLSVTNGTLALNANPVTVTVSGTTLPLGSYRLIAKATGANPGAVGGTLPSSVLVNGAGAASSASLQILGGELYLVVGATTVGLTSSANPSGYLNGVSFTASVRTNGVIAGNATGAVTFFSGATPFSTNALVAGAAGSSSLNSLPRGTNTITAVYGGNANYLGSTNALAQVVTNHPPVAPVVNYSRTPGIATCRITIADLLTNVTDLDGDSVTLTATGVSTNGITLLNSAGFLLYQNTNNVNDQFTYTVDDANGGSTTGSINVVVQAFVTGQSASVAIAGSTATVSFHGIPGYPYGVQRSTNLTVWATIATTNAPANGAFEWTDDFSDLGVVPGSAYYRLQWNP